MRGALTCADVDGFGAGLLVGVLVGAGAATCVARADVDGAATTCVLVTVGVGFVVDFVAVRDGTMLVRSAATLCDAAGSWAGMLVLASAAATGEVERFGCLSDEAWLMPTMSTAQPATVMVAAHALTTRPALMP